MTKLYELLAIEADLRNTADVNAKEARSLFGTEDNFLGVIRNFDKLLESEPDAPPERKELPNTVLAILAGIELAVGDFIDVTISKEMSNVGASATVEIGDVEWELSATALLNLESRLDEIKRVYSTIPTLPLNQKWSFDEQKGCFVSEQREQLRTIKRAKSHVLYDATKEHPAQVELVNVDIPAYNIETTVFSGMVTASHKEECLERIDDLRRRIKQARQRANSVEAKGVCVAKDIFDFING